MIILSFFLVPGSLWDLVVSLQLKNGPAKVVKIPFQVMKELKKPPKEVKRTVQDYYAFPREQLVQHRMQQQRQLRVIDR